MIQPQGHDHIFMLQYAYLKLALLLHKTVLENFLSSTTVVPLFTTRGRIATKQGRFLVFKVQL